jgi:transcriptional regulator with XRE-family HTH domain
VGIKEKQQNFIIALGVRVVQLRKEKGFSQYELTYKTNLERSTIQNIEKGLINSGVACLPELAEAFDISVSELLDFDYLESNDNQE